MKPTTRIYSTKEGGIPTAFQPKFWNEGLEMPKYKWFLSR